MPSTAPAPSCFAARKCARVAGCTDVDDGVEHVLLQGVAGDVLEVAPREQLDPLVVERAVGRDDLAADEPPVVDLLIWALLEARRVVHEHFNEGDRLGEQWHA